MQEQSQTTGTWRIGFDLAAFVLLATIAGMAAAVTLASIALVLSGAVSSAPAANPGAPITVPSAPEVPSPAPATHTEVARSASPAR
jgi:hypothetical protein